MRCGGQQDFNKFQKTPIIHKCVTSKQPKVWCFEIPCKIEKTDGRRKEKLLHRVVLKAGKPECRKPGMPERRNAGNQDPEILKPGMTNIFRVLPKTRKTFFVLFVELYH